MHPSAQKSGRYRSRGDLSIITLHCRGNNIKKTIGLIVALLFCIGSGVAGAGQQPDILQRLERDLDHCGFFIFNSSATTEQILVFMTDDLGEGVTRAWINLGRGDVELRKVSYHEDDQGIQFLFAGEGMQVEFDGTIIVPASESQEYHVLRGKFTIKRGSTIESWVVSTHSGC